MIASAYHQLRGLGQSGNTVTAAAGQVLMAAAPLTGPAKPFVQLAGSITELLATLGVGKGCGATCITATVYANQAELLLKQNLATYLALPTPRPASAQQAAIANFNQIWFGLEYACTGVPGTAGQNCIGDREQGACHFHDAQGNCWNWFTGYYDPIANDPNVVPDALSASSNPASSIVSTLTGAAGGNDGLLLIGAALIGGAILMEVL